MKVVRAATLPAMKFCPMTPTLAASRPQPVSSLVRCIFPVLYMLGNCGLYPGRFKYCVVGYEALGLAETMHDAGVLLWQALAGRVQDASPNWPFVGCGLGISSSVTGCPPVSHNFVACVVSRQWSTLCRVPKVSGKLLGVRPMSGSSALSPRFRSHFGDHFSSSSLSTISLHLLQRPGAPLLSPPARNLGLCLRCSAICLL